MFSCFACGTDSLTTKLLKKSLKNVKPKTKKALTEQQALQLAAQPQGAAKDVQPSCAQPSWLGGGCVRPAANRIPAQPDSPIQQPANGAKQQLRDRADPAQLQLARESFISALTSALEVASRDKGIAVTPSESGTPFAASSGPSSPTSRTFSLERSLSGENSDGASDGDEADIYASRHGSTHDSCISWTKPAPLKGQTSFVVVPITAANPTIDSPSLSSVADEPLEATRMLRVRTAFESFKHMRAQLKDLENASPKESRNAVEELAWAQEAMNVSKKLQQQLPSSELGDSMRQELEAATAELEASAQASSEALSGSDSDDDTILSTHVHTLTVSAEEQAEIEAALAARRSADVECMDTAFSEASAPASPLAAWGPLDSQPLAKPDFAAITDVCLSNIRTMASAATAGIQLEQEDDLGPAAPARAPVSTLASKIQSTCDAAIANTWAPLPACPSTSSPQTAAQACCSSDGEEEPLVDASQLTCICSMIADLQLSDVLRCPKCQQRPGSVSACHSAQKPPRHPGRAYRAASLQRLRIAASC